MERSHYLHVHIPGRGRITLSLPAGLERAIISGRLPADAEVWQADTELWVPLSRHPEVRRLLQLAALPALPRETGRALESLASPPTMPAPPPTDPDQLPLIPMEDPEPHREFVSFLQRSSAAEERRRVVRTSGGIRPSGPARVFVAGSLELRRRQRRLQRLVARYSVPGWAAALVVTVLAAFAVVSFFVGRAAGHSDLPIPVTITNALSAGWSGATDSAPPQALVEPNPLAVEERELENNVRIAEAVVWQPAIDFTPEQVRRSSRKVDAVRNSISLYRIGAWRLMDSTQREEDPRLESYEEATRVDEILNLVQSAIGLLDSLVAGFRVNGDLLVFRDSLQAERYRWLRHRADSLLRSPVPSDSLPLARAPRRVVARLVETMPTAVIE